ncbi:MAG: EVE domain-containing protein [Alphaproteobacteria bacterium]|nr:EVE domain-containing protein [Alphaproteobacteria bacterium]
MNYWLIKTEPSTWSWEQQKTRRTTHWDGVRNYQASNNLKAMEIGDLCFFYHSMYDRKVVGIVKVIETYHPDPTDPTGRFGMVGIEYVKELVNPVSLTQIKSHPQLQSLALVRQSRLSVMPIDAESWEIILGMSR